jgi:hypothetical protein
MITVKGALCLLILPGKALAGLQVVRKGSTSPKNERQPHFLPYGKRFILIVYNVCNIITRS